MANFDEQLNLMAIIDLEEAEILVENQPNRIFHARDDPFVSLTDHEFIREYRLSKEMVEELINLLQPFMIAETRKSGLSIKVKVSFIEMLQKVTHNEKVYIHCRF